MVLAWSVHPASGFVLENIVWNIPNPTLFVNLSASQGSLGTNLAGFPLIDGLGSYNQVFEGAVASWDSYLADLQIQTVEGTNPNGFDENNDLCEAGFGSAAGGSSLGADTLAVTEIYYDQGTPNTFAPTDIVFSTSYAWNSYRGPLLDSPIDLRRVALHELGHFIGLDHPDQYGQNVAAIMNSVISDTDELTSDDVTGGQYLYGARSGGLTYAPKSGDFNADGRQDLFWRNGSSSYVSAWLMNSLSVAAYSYLQINTSAYRIFGFADFNGDGKSDVVWQNNGGNSIAIWIMDGVNPAFYLTVNAPGPNYYLAAVGDIDGDGKADLVWRDFTSGDVIIQKNNGITGSTLSLTQVFEQNPGIDWNIVAAANLNANPQGRVELIWQASDRTVAAWFFSGFQPVQYPLYGQVTGTWRLVAVADCNGDGIDDLVWFDPVNRYVSVWYMNGAGAPGKAFLGVAGEPWVFAGAANVDGAGGRAQLFWSNPDTGQLSTWSLANPYQPAYQLPNLSANPVWTIQPAR